MFDDVSEMLAASIFRAMIRSDYTAQQSKDDNLLV
jgi:hypothetical protein